MKEDLESVSFFPDMFYFYAYSGEMMLEENIDSHPKIMSWSFLFRHVHWAFVVGLVRQKMGVIVSFVGIYMIGVPLADGLTMYADFGIKVRFFQYCILLLY